ncbi:MAG: class I SAM-dependent methyltransferase [Bauldia sp.]|nr:class I SAM-dependent methyltransferase [Bauldia sp.]
MSLFPLDLLLKRIIRHGTLTVVDTTGRAQRFEGRSAGPHVTVRLVDPKFPRRMVRNPGLLLGEGYVDGAYVIEEGTLRDFLEVLMVSTATGEPAGIVGAIASRAASVLGGRNTLGRATKNVQHHYDIDHSLYELFLDRDMQYSCAYWRPGVTSLDDAQRDKKRHLARKLLLQPGMKVLDIGSGWGGLALHLAREHGVHVTGLTLSTDQYETSLRRAQAEGLSDRVTFKLLDYRQEAGVYDRIVSVGMFEHVGRQHFGEFFRHLDRLLKPEGLAVLHTIGRMATPGGINAWVRKYIFPGTYLPSLSQLSPELERRGLWMTDYEMLRLHYAETLKAWDERFQAKRAEIAARFDERFCRMWEFYLQSCEAGFRHRSLVVFQLQITKQIGTAPITRDYMYADAPAQPVAAPQPVAAARATASAKAPRKSPAKAAAPDGHVNGAKANGHAPARTRAKPAPTTAARPRSRAARPEQDG